MCASSSPARLLLALAATLAAVLAVGLASAGAASGATREVVVRFKQTAGAAERAAALRAAGLGAARVRPTAAGAVSAMAGSTRAAGAAAARLERSGAVAWAGRAVRARIAQTGPAAPARAPANDTGTTTRVGPPGGWQEQQWNLVGPFGIDVLGAWAAVTEGTGRAPGDGVTVAVLDTGVAYATRGAYRRSPDLPPSQVGRGFDFVSRDRRADDANGHGTFVASTIAAATNNGVGMAGIAHGARIMPLRVLNAAGEGSSARVAEGIEYAARNGAQVINASIEFAEPDPEAPGEERSVPFTYAPEIRAAIRTANELGAVVIAAAGNIADARVPTRELEDEIVYVGGTTERGCVGRYSNHGPGLDLVAPGGGADAYLDDDGDARCAPYGPPGRNIFQVTFAETEVPGRFGLPSDYDGTSMAAPHVSGVAAVVAGVLKARGRPVTPDTVTRVLTGTARDLGAPGADRLYGAGLVDAAGAVRRALAVARSARRGGSRPGSGSGSR